MESIYHRVSIRRFQDRPVEKEKTDAILRAAMQAPSAANQQPWEFYVVTNRDKIQSLAKSHPYAGAAANAPVVIVPVYRKECPLPSALTEILDSSVCASSSSKASFNRRLVIRTRRFIDGSFIKTSEAIQYRSTCRIQNKTGKTDCCFSNKL